MEASVLVGGGNQPASGHDSNPGQTFLARILESVQITVVEDLADHVGAVKGRVGNDAHGRCRYLGEWLFVSILITCAWLTYLPSVTPAPTTSSSLTVCAVIANIEVVPP